MDDGFPALIFLCLGVPTRHDTRVALPPTFEAPHLRYLILIHFFSPCHLCPNPTCFVTVQHNINEGMKYMFGPSLRIVLNICQMRVDEG
jgi:hypothetical protein